MLTDDDVHRINRAIYGDPRPSGCLAALSALAAIALLVLFFPFPFLLLLGALLGWTP